MSRAKDVVVWTEDGLSRLARANQWGVFHHGTDDDETLRRLVTVGVERLRPMWLRGLSGPESSDAEGCAAVAFASDALTAGELPDDASVEQAAWAASLLGGYGDMMGPLAEQIVRRRGGRFAIEVLIRMWWQVTTDAKPPGFTSGEDSVQIRLRTMVPDDRSRNHGYSQGKAQFARYLLRSYRSGRATLRADMLAAVEAAWPTAASQLLAPLAVAISDPVRGADAAIRLLADRRRVHVGFAAWTLPFLLEDPPLVRKLLSHGHANPDLRLLENLGTRALPIYDACLERGHGIRELIVQLYNVRGPRTARIVARYAEQRPDSVIVQNYFADSPELLIALRRDPKFDQARLARLERKLGISTWT